MGPAITQKYSQRIIYVVSSAGGECVNMDKANLSLLGSLCPHRNTPYTKILSTPETLQNRGLGVFAEPLGSTNTSERSKARKNLILAESYVVFIKLGIGPPARALGCPYRAIGWPF